MPLINSDKALQTLKAMQAEITVIATESPVMLAQLMGYVRSTVLLKNDRNLSSWRVARIVGLRLSITE